MKVKVCFQEHVEGAVLDFRAVDGGEKQHIVGLGGNCLLYFLSVMGIGQNKQTFSLLMAL